MNKQLQIVQTFFEEIGKSISAKNTLLLSMVQFETFKINKLPNVIEVKSEAELKKLTNKFEFIIGDLPLGMPLKEIDSTSKLKVNGNWSFILQGLRNLEESGKAFFIVEPSILMSQIGENFLIDLEAENYFLSAAFNPPEKIYYPPTIFRPVILSFSRSKTDKLFIAEIENENINEMANNYVLHSNFDNLSLGTLVDKSSFTSFYAYKIDNQINKLKTQYNNYTKYELTSLCLEINLTRTVFEERENTIYVPNIGNSQIVSSIRETKLKHQNYFQLVLDTNKVKAEYLVLFYKSELGKLILSSLSKGDIIPKINKSTIGKSIVAVPNIKEQDLLIHTDNKLSELQNTIDELKLELSLNPNNANVILDKFDSIQGPLKSLSDEDKILGIIRKGEGKHVEFKQTFSKNIRTNQKDLDIEKATLKNIVGFLNTDGGTLLIGVSDKGEIIGIEEDFYNSDDKYLLNFKNAINSKIGSEFYPLIDYGICSVRGKKTFKIGCLPSSEPCFYDEKEFYVRTNPATDKLEGRKQLEYIKNRFK